jgi:hypothetical protein
MPRDSPKVGWFKFSNSRKFHWIVAGRSLCGKWLYLGNGELDFSVRELPDDCVACRRKLDANGFIAKDRQPRHSSNR